MNYAKFNPKTDPYILNEKNVELMKAGNLAGNKTILIFI
jgi:hypothetical protein